VQQSAIAIDPGFAEIFVRDASKAIKSLEAVAKKNNYNDDINLRTFIINVHGIKSALANVGKTELADLAMKLESAGRENRLDILELETEGFLCSLKAFVDELSPKEEEDAAENEADRQRLLESLQTIKAACGDFDENTAEEALAGLKKTPWSKETRGLLSEISENLLHSDFDEVVEAIDRFINPA